MKPRRIAAVCLAALIALSGCASRAPAPDVPPDMPVTPAPQPPVESDAVEAVDEWSRTIAYVPLDDRPDNVERVVYLAEAAGYRVVFPDAELYSTRLDGQGKNANGTQCGDRGALLEWVRQADEAGCGLFLLSLDQLLSGGLVSSRAMSEPEDIVFPDGSTMSEQDAIDAYLVPLAQDPDNRVYFFDSLMRLASTVGYNGYDLAHYTAIRAYGNVARPALSGDELTLEAIIAAYPYAEDGRTAAESSVEDEASRSILSGDVTAAYCGARARKLRLTDHLLRQTEGLANCYTIIGVDDSSSLDNIQTNEMAYLTQLLSGRGILMGGVDDLGMMLVARIAVDDAGLSVPVRCTYIGGRENEPATQFDHQTLKESVGFHVAALGGYEAADGAQDALELVVLSAPDDEAKAGEYAASLREKLSDNLSRGVPTVWIDASANGCGGLNDELLAAVPLGSLLGYSGFCDLAIVAGAGVSQGFARYAYLASGAEKGADADRAFVKSLTVGLVLGGAYKTDTRPVLDPFIRELGLDPNNILGTAEQRAQIQKKLEDTLLPACAPLMQNLSRSPVISDLSGGASGPFSVSVRAPYLPWSRTFESCFTIDVQSEPPA